MQKKPITFKQIKICALASAIISVLFLFLGLFLNYDLSDFVYFLYAMVIFLFVLVFLLASRPNDSPK